MPRVVRFVVCFALSMLVPSAANAQVGGSGSIQGTVLDTSNAAVPGATVTATNVATGDRDDPADDRRRRLRADAAATRASIA